MSDEVQLIIRTAEELQEALYAPDLAIRAAVLQAIQEDPAGALSCGTHAGRDALDVMLELARAADAGSSEWIGMLLMVARFQDPRAVSYLFQNLGRCEETEVID